MAILPIIMQGSAMFAALLESTLTALLYSQVRRYSAEAPKTRPTAQAQGLPSNDHDAPSQGSQDPAH